MKKHFKSHIKELVRYQTSVGRDLENGARLDRNERVSSFDTDIIEDVYRQFKSYSFCASPDMDSLYQNIARFLDIPRDTIYVLGGITEGIKVLYESLTNPGENVVVLDPTYPFYSIYAKLYRLEYRKFKYKKDLSPDWDSLYNNIDDKTTFVMLPNPNLPIESVFTEGEIKSIADKCKKHDTILVIDEAYHYFGAPTVLPLVNEYDNLVVMRTFSKAFGLAGLRLGFMVTARENIDYVSKTRSLVETNTFTAGIAEYMLTHPEIMKKHIQEVKEGGLYIQEKLTKMGLKWYGGNVTNGILVFMSSSEESRSVVEELKKKKIYIRGAFEPPFDNCIRVSIGHQAEMKIFCDALRKLMKK